MNKKELPNKRKRKGSKEGRTRTVGFFTTSNRNSNSNSSPEREEEAVASRSYPPTDDERARYARDESLSFAFCERRDLEVARTTDGSGQVTNKASQMNAHV